MTSSLSFTTKSHPKIFGTSIHHGGAWLLGRFTETKGLASLLGVSVRPFYFGALEQSIWLVGLTIVC